jgi:hypothetical protein
MLSPRVLVPVGRSYGDTEPLTLFAAEERENSSEVDLVFRPRLLGLVEELDLRGEIRDASAFVMPSDEIGR